MKDEKKLLETVDRHKKEIVQFLKDLIKIPSVTGDEKHIQAFVARKLEAMGLKVDSWEPSLEKLKKHPAFVPVEMDYRDRPNVVGIHRGKGGGRSLLFNGHVDVIPAEPRAAWIHDPWKAEIAGDKLYGRGASDMKGGLAAMTMALDCVIETGIDLRGDVILEYVVDEEISGHGTLDCILRGYKADAGISCEAGDLEVQPATTGSMWFEIKVEGKSSSMSRIWEAVSAIEKGHRIYKAVSDHQAIRIMDKKHPLYFDSRGSLACFVGMFNSGNYPSSPSEMCVLKGRMGVLPNENPKQVQEEFTKYIENVAKTDPWLRKHPPITRFVGYYAEPAEIPSEHPICRCVADSFEQTTGRKATIRGHEGAADTRFLIQYGETPTVIFGPGTITQMHATNEWIRIDDLICAVKVLAVSISNWCK